jgi:hypothetical protein
MDGPEGQAAAELDFARTRELGIQGYPTLVLAAGERMARLPTFEASPEEIVRQVRSVL